MNKQRTQRGFTLVEIAIVLLVVTIILGYTVAMFPRQQELKKYNALDRDMDEIMQAIVGFAQVTGRLPCPALPNTLGIEDYDAINDDGCDNYGGFVPINTLGLSGRVNRDSLLIDPWGNPYRYYVSNVDVDLDGLSDFTAPGEMRDVGLVDIVPAGGDGYIDLDGQFLICDDNGTTTDDQCTDANEVFGTYAAGPPVVYGGAPFVLLSPGSNWRQGQPNAGCAGGDPADGGMINDELENIGGNYTCELGIAVGPSGNNYTLKNYVGNNESTFVRRNTGFAENVNDPYDDVVRWISPNILYSKMIEADQLP